MPFFKKKNNEPEPAANNYNQQPQQRPPPEYENYRNYRTINDTDDNVKTLRFTVKQSNGCVSFLRFVLGVINFVIALISLALMAFGIVGIMYLNTIFKMTKEQGLYIPIIFIVVSIFLLCFSVSSCFCNPRKNNCCIYTYSFVQLISFLVIIIGVIVFFDQKPAIEESFKTGFQSTIKNYTKNKDEIDFIQKHLKCCGSNNNSDYENADIKAAKIYNVPKSCCLTKLPNCNTTIYPNTTNNEIFDVGCNQSVVEFIDNHIVVLIGLAVGLSLIPLVSCILSCLMLHCAKNSDLQFEYQRY